MMFELTIDGSVYQFNFGFWFRKALNEKMKVTVKDVPGKNEKIGLSYTIAQVIDGDIDYLIDLLDAANKGQDVRVTRAALEQYIEDESTDIDALFEQVIDFLKTANASRKETLKILENLEKQKEAKQETAAR